MCCVTLTHSAHDEGGTRGRLPISGMGDCLVFEVPLC